MFLPFLHISYAHGFVRRGLLGTIFQFFADGMPPNEQEMQILAVHVLALAALLGGVVAETMRLARGATTRTRVLLATGTATFLLSRFVLTIAHNAGYQDVLLVLLAFVAARLLAHDCKWAALAVATVAPFLHEGFLFRGRRWRFLRRRARRARSRRARDRSRGSRCRGSRRSRR